MSERTPTTEDVLSAYLYDCHRHRKGGLIAEFDRWLEQVKAEAWDEGFDAGEREVFHLDTHPDYTCTPNPYRQKEQDQ